MKTAVFSVLVEVVIYDDTNPEDIFIDEITAREFNAGQALTCTVEDVKLLEIKE